MIFENILYTPLDTKPMPDFNIEELYNWLNISHQSQISWRKKISRFTSENSNFLDSYPWNISIAYFNMFGKGPGWLDQFEIKFPQLAEYISTCFGITVDNFGSIVMLPMKSDNIGPGFYHQDHDWYGLRMYLEFEDYQSNSLYIRRTVIPYDKQTMIDTPVDENLLQKDEIKAKILHNKQCWYINNVRACHSTYTKIPGKKRIAVLITSRFSNHDTVFPIIKDMVLKSAKKFPEYVIEWKPEK
jgi:hypothetical protein